MKPKFSFLIYFLAIFGLVSLACGLNIDMGNSTQVPPTLPAPIVASSPLPNPPTVAQLPVEQPTATTAPDTTATALMEGIQGDVKYYFEEGYLPSKEGTYTRLEDFTKSSAKINYDTLEDIHHSAKDFMLRAHYAWKSAIKFPDPGGCVIGFRAERGNYYAMLVDSDTAWVMRWDNGMRQFTRIGVNKGNAVVGLGNPAEADVVFIVNKDKAHVFIDQRLVGTYVLDSDTLTGSGDLSLGVVAGTTKDYGTQCKMTNIDLWVID